MASYLTSSTLIESVKRRASIPQSQSTFTEDDLLAFANEELSIGLLPSILQFHEEFLVYETTVPLYSGVQNYSIPGRAIGGKVRNVFYMDTNGNPQTTARISPENVVYYNNTTLTSNPTYYLKNNELVFVNKIGGSISPSNPPTPAGGSLKISYYLRPNQLVSEKRCAVIKSIDATTNTVVIDGVVPSVFSPVNVGFKKLDIIESVGGHRTKAMDIVPTNIVFGTVGVQDGQITFSELPPNLVPGDHIALAGETMIPQIPDDLHSVLAQRVAARCLEALGDQNGLQAANLKLQEMEQKTGNLIDNRTEGQPQKVINFRGLLRNSRIRRRGRLNGPS